MTDLILPEKVINNLSKGKKVTINTADLGNPGHNMSVTLVPPEELDNTYAVYPVSVEKIHEPDGE